MKEIKKTLVFALFFLAVIWAVTILDQTFSLGLGQYGILPREFTIKSLVGIFVSPFVHGNFAHLIANSIPLFVLLIILRLSYKRLAVKVVVLSILFGGISVWAFARGGSHIGASGLIFSIVGFLIAGVLFRIKQWQSVLVGLLVGVLYGGALWGIFPSDAGISWEGHLFGLISGILLAYFMRKQAIK